MPKGGPQVGKPGSFSPVLHLSGEADRRRTSLLESPHSTQKSVFALSGDQQVHFGRVKLNLLMCTEAAGEVPL